MAGYIGSKASVVSSGAERKKTFAITTSTTSLTGLSYTVDQVHVFHNGVRLVDGTDYTATNGTSITLTSAAESGDEVVVVSYATFQTSDTVSASAGGTFAAPVTIDASSATALTVDRATTDGTIIDVQRGGTTVGSIGVEASSLLVKTHQHGNTLIFAGEDTGGSETRLGMVNATGSEAFRPYNSHSDAKYNLGRDDRRFKDLYLSGGVCLGGTGAANKLDDYEEGTWTPVMGSVTHTNSGKYAKIGSLVFLSIGDRSASAVPDGGSMTITGLPFTVAGWEWTGSLAVTWGDASNGYQYRVATGRQVPNNTLIVYNRGGVGTTTSDPWNISVVYRTNA